MNTGGHCGKHALRLTLSGISCFIHHDTDNMMTAAGHCHTSTVKRRHASASMLPLMNSQSVLTSFLVHFIGLATKWKPPSSFVTVDLSEPTFCHAPWILATSDLLAIHLNYHVTADHCQRHLLLEWKRQTTFIVNKLQQSALSGWSIANPNPCFLLIEGLFFKSDWSLPVSTDRT